MKSSPTLNPLVAMMILLFVLKSWAIYLKRKSKHGGTLHRLNNNPMQIGPQEIKVGPPTQ